jgi:hypothetical protein
MNIKKIGRRNTVRTLVVGAGVLAAVAVVGCGTQSPSAQNTGSPGSQTVAAGVPSSPSTSTSDSSASQAANGNPTPANGSGASNGSGAVAASHTGGTPECKAGNLALSFGGGDAGMNQQERVLRFTNTGKQTCAIVGFPGVSYVAGDNGQQVGAPAVRTGKIGAQVNLAPGAVASTVIHSVNPGVFDASACQPTAVRGYRIYAPDDLASMFIALPSGAQGCAGNPPDPQLSVVTVKAGLGNPDQG